MPFRIRSDSLILEIALADTHELHLHEDTIPDFVEKLAEALKQDGMVRHPVIVDRTTHVVLDGMHRVVAARKIGCRRMPVCFVDYESSTVLIGRWVRSISGKSAISKTLGKLADDCLPFEKVDLGVGENALRSRRARMLVETRDSCFIIGNWSDIRAAYSTLVHLERALLASGFHVEYDTEADARDRLRSDQVSVLLSPPLVSKQEVVRCALSGNPLPHKSTRHLIPARPLGVDCSLELLTRDEITMTEADASLSSTLGSRRILRFPPGSEVDGRKYEEEIYLFSNSMTSSSG